MSTQKNYRKKTRIKMDCKKGESREVQTDENKIREPLE
jgi:hypothetical protein